MKGLTKAKLELLADIAGDEWDVYEGTLGGTWKTTKQGFVTRVNKGTLRALLSSGLAKSIPAMDLPGRWGKTSYRVTPAGNAALAKARGEA